MLWHGSSWLSVHDVLAQAAGHLLIDVFPVADSMDYDALAFEPVDYAEVKFVDVHGSESC